MPSAVNLPARVLTYWRTLRTLGSEARARHGVSAWHMLREHRRLRRLTRLRLNEYFMYGLFDPAMPWEAKAEYLGGRLIRQLWSAFNPIEYRYLFKNKLVFKQICLGARLPVPEFLGVFDPDWGYTATGGPLRTPGDLKRWIADLSDPNVVIKPTAGAEGRMVRAFCGKAAGGAPALLTAAAEEWPAERLYAFMTDAEALEQACSGAVEVAPTFLFERRLRPHPDLAALSPDTLCTLRVLTLRDRGLPARVLRAIYKLQTAGSGVDNLAQGSVAIAVDMETGVLGTGWTKPKANRLPDPKRLEADPATGARFTGVRVPYWREVLDVALRGAEAFSSVRVLGWDIAVTPQGPFILEGNWSWGETGAQAGFGRGLYFGDFRHVADRLIAEGKANRALV